MPVAAAGPQAAARTAGARLAVRGGRAGLVPRRFAPSGIHRNPAQRLARRELARSIYHASFWTRLYRDLFGWLNRLSIGPAHEGWWTLIALIVALVLVIAGILSWIGPLRRGRREPPGPVLEGARLTAGDHRRAARRLADDGDFAGAIIERVRAIVVELESRDVLLPRPGRTASELAAEAASSLPGSAAGLREAARLFDDVRYGGRAGTLAGYQQVRDLDESIRAARTPAVSVASGGRPIGPASRTGQPS